MNYRLLIIAAMLHCIVGCVADPSIEPYTDSEEHTVTLSVEPFTDEVVGTRSTPSDVLIKRGYLLFYNSANGAYKGYQTVEDLNIIQSGSTVSFDVDAAYSATDKIIAIFNHDESAALPSDFGAVTSDNIGEFFPLSAAYLSKIEAEMNSGADTFGLPMYLNDFTDSDRAVREVYRSVARMELFIKEGLTIDHDSHTHGIGADNLSFQVVNAAAASSVGIGDHAVVGECFDVDNFGGSFPYDLTEYQTVANNTNNKVYLYPYPYASRAVDGSALDVAAFDKDRFAIIMRHGDKNIYDDRPEHESRYYKLNLLDKATSTYFDVVRNHNYRVVITAVNSRGYETLKEAYEMPPSNIEYEIYDDKGGLTYSNGQYAISMDEILSYDEVLVYGANETKLEFNNIRYVLPYGGQMSDSDFITNEVEFNVLNDSEGLIIDQKSDFSFDGNGKSVLTANGQSISLTLSGEGECTIALRIKLGNLEMGRDDITIKKVATNGGGDGSFDAHPNHVEIAGQEFIEGSWQSDDIDFGARASSSAYDKADGGTVIYMGENATPTGYRTMDGYVSGESSINSYPVFSPKTRRGFYAYKRASDGETRKVMIQLDQLAPFYLGHFGNTASKESLYHYNGLICEKIEEIPHVDWQGEHAIDGVMEWSKAQQTYFKGTIWGDYLGFGDRYHNLVNGLDITKNIVENNTSPTTLPSAAYYCYMKNDVNGNGRIDGNETIDWFLPAQNQALAMWINMNVFDQDGGQYRLNNSVSGDDRTYYWTCSEVDEQSDYTWNLPNNFDSHAWAFNMLEGQADFEAKNNTYKSGQCHIRCVRGL